MYGNFLRESGELLRIDELTKLGGQYVAVGEEWDHVADQFLHLSETLDRECLRTIAPQIRDLSEKEGEIMRQLQAFSQ